MTVFNEKSSSRVSGAVAPDLLPRQGLRFSFLLVLFSLLFTEKEKKMNERLFSK